MKRRWGGKNSFFEFRIFSIAYRSIYRFLGQFWWISRNLVDFWRNLGYRGFRGRWIEWRCWISFKIDIFRSNRPIRSLRTDRFWLTFSDLVDFWRNFGYRGFQGRWIEWQCTFLFKWDIFGRIDMFDRLYDELGRASRVMGPLQPQWLVSEN